jgi:uncharacterized membrane protein YtjA (UPF0391 family)
MFSWAIAFFVIALIAAFFGFFGLAASAAGIAKVIFFVALILALVSFVGAADPPFERDLRSTHRISGGRKARLRCERKHPDRRRR